MSIDTIPNYCYGTISKKIDLQKIIDEVKSWGTLPKGWRMLVAQSSVQLSNPKRTKFLKIDIYRNVYVDQVMKHGIVKSSKHLSPSFTDTFTIAKQFFDSLTSNEPKVQRESSETPPAVKEAKRSRDAKIDEECGTVKNPSWWVLV